MAHLMLFYQLMRAKREVNTLSSDLFKYTSKKDRIKRSITAQQKRFEGRKQQITAQAKMMQSNATMMFQNMMGLGCNATNPYMNMGGATEFICKFLAQKYGDDTAKLLEAYYNTGGTFKQAGADGNAAFIEGMDEQRAGEFKNMMMQAQMQQQNAQQFVNQMNTSYANSVSVWEQAQLAALEAEQDAMLEPLNYEETMMELDETNTKALLDQKKEEVNNLKQELAQRAKEDAVSFGLG